MRQITEQEGELIASLKAWHEQYQKLPYFLDSAGKELVEVKKHVDALEYIILVRAMLRDSVPAPEQAKELGIKQKQIE